MISGEPRVVERDGERVLVDGAGEELICRRETGRYIRRVYHHVDLAAFPGAIRPACHCGRYDDGHWILKRRSTLNETWDGCEYGRCCGETPRASGRSASTHYRTLAEMSVEEFDQARGASDE